MATDNMPIIYSTENRTDGTVRRLVIVTAPGKFEEHSVFRDTPKTEKDYNEDSRDIFDNPKRGIGYMTYPSHLADQMTNSVIENASDEAIATFKTRISSARKKLSDRI